MLIAQLIEESVNKFKLKKEEKKMNIAYLDLMWRKNKVEFEGHKEMNEE